MMRGRKGRGRHGETRDTYSVLDGKREGRRHLEDLGADGKIINVLIFQKWYRKVFP